MWSHEVPTDLELEVPFHNGQSPLDFGVREVVENTNDNYKHIQLKTCPSPLPGTMPELSLCLRSMYHQETGGPNRTLGFNDLPADREVNGSASKQGRKQREILSRHEREPIPA